MNKRISRRIEEGGGVVQPIRAFLLNEIISCITAKNRRKQVKKRETIRNMM